MKILLIDPLHQVWEFFRGHVVYPGFAAIVAQMQGKGHDLVIYDGTVEDPAWRTLHQLLERERPDLVAITHSITCYSADAEDTAKLVRTVLPDTKIVCGGEHVSLAPEEVLRTGLFDLAILGEGEFTFEEVVKAYDAGEDVTQVKGVGYLDADNRFVRTEARAPIEDLDSLPLPPYHLFPMERYGIPALGGKVGFATTFSRGCPYRCAFCSEAAFWNHKQRMMSARRVAEELDRLSRDWDRHMFYVGDGNFLFDRPFAEDFIREMQRIRPEVQLWIQTSVDTVVRNKDLLPALRDAGVFQLMLGIESVNEENLKFLKKTQNIGKFEEAAKLTREAGMLVFGMLTWGAWNDTEETLKATIDFLRQHSDTIAPNLLTPFPGTALYDWARENNVLFQRDYRKYDFRHAIMPTKTLSVEDVDRIFNSEIGKALMFDRRAFENLLFPKHPILRRYLVQFVKMGFRAQIRTPWVQPNFETLDEYLRREIVGKRVVSG